MAHGDDIELRTAAVSAATGYSAQQIRDLEARGVVECAPRKANGYRVFSTRHVRDLRAYRDLARAVGPVEARRVMRQIRVLVRDEAAALVASLHTGLTRERDHVLEARRALVVIRAEAAIELEPAESDTMTITELAGALGVRASTLRFWETEGLVTPHRVATRAGSARRYPLAAIREARIVAGLRASGYRIPDVRRASQHSVTSRISSVAEGVGHEGRRHRSANPLAAACRVRTRRDHHLTRGCAGDMLYWSARREGGHMYIRSDRCCIRYG